MSDSDQEDKTEDPTGKQEERFRKRGDVFRSQDVSVVVSLAGGIGALLFAWGVIGGGLSEITRVILGSLDMHHNNDHFVNEALIATAKIMAPVALTGFVLGIAAQIAMVGFNFTFEPMEFKPEKFNPFPKIKSMFFSQDTLIEIAKSVIKILVVGGLAVSILWEEVANNGRLLALTPVEILQKIGRMGLRIVLTVLLALAFITILDVLVEKWRHKKKMKMTKKEVEQEHKDTDGDPLIKGKIRAKQMEMARGRGMGDVTEADVVVANPTHYSVAIRYDMAKDAAPIIVAMGVDDLATKIREEARRNTIPVVSDPPLARALYAEGKMGEPIPKQFFSAVASLLAWVYKVTGKM
jgi:flagellar biosynthetic protein FlhB